MPQSKIFTSISPVLIGLLLVFLKNKRIDHRLMAAIILLSFVLPLVHIFSMIYYLLAVVGLLLFSSLLEKKYQVAKKTLLLLAGWAVLASPVLYFLLQSYSQIVPTNSGEPNTKATILFGNVFVVNPSIWQSGWIIAALVSLLVLTVWQYRFIKKTMSIPLALCFVLTFGAAVASFFAPISTMLGKLITLTFLARLVSVVPVTFVLALLLFELSRRNKRLEKNFSFFFYPAATVAIILIGWHLATPKKIGESLNQRTYFLYEHPVHRYVEKNISSEMVIASSEKVSYEVAAMTDNYVVMIPAGHCPAIVDKNQRLTDLEEIFDPRPWQATYEALKKYDVDYVLAKNQEVSKFESNDTAFSIVYSGVYNGSTYKLFKIDKRYLN